MKRLIYYIIIAAAVAASTVSCVTERADEPAKCASGLRIYSYVERDISSSLSDVASLFVLNECLSYTEPAEREAAVRQYFGPKVTVVAADDSGAKWYVIFSSAQYMLTIETGGRLLDEAGAEWVYYRDAGYYSKDAMPKLTSLGDGRYSLVRRGIEAEQVYRSGSMYSDVEFEFMPLWKFPALVLPEKPAQPENPDEGGATDPSDAQPQETSPALKNEPAYPQNPTVYEYYDPERNMVWWMNLSGKGVMRSADAVATVIEYTIEPDSKYSLTAASLTSGRLSATARTVWGDDVRRIDVIFSEGRGVLRYNGETEVVKGGYYY